MRAGLLGGRRGALPRSTWLQSTWLRDVRLWLGAASLLVVASLACASSPEPQFYTLFAAAGSALASPPWQVELRRPGLPGYLDRPQIVRHEAREKLEFSGAARWGEPLQDMIGRILAQNLAQRLPSARVYTESGAISSSPDALVELDIQRFELTEDGSVELVAQVALHWPKTPAQPRLDRYTLRRSPKNGSTERLVTEMSGLLAELANTIAHSLSDETAAPSSSASSLEGTAP